MNKEEELLLEWRHRREEIIKFIDKYIPATRYHNDEGLNLFRMIMDYGNSQGAHATEKCKKWMIKKLED